MAQNSRKPAAFLLRTVLALVAALALVMGLAPAASAAPALAAGPGVTAEELIPDPGATVPGMDVKRDCGWTGCTWYFNKSETKRIAWGISTCAAVVPGPVKAACAILAAMAAGVVAFDKCLKYRIPGGAGWHSGKYCK